MSAPTVVKRGQSREALIDAAATLFAARGPGAVALREVARHAGVSYALIHRHFGTKEGLLAAVLDDLTKDLSVAMLGVVSGREASRIISEHSQLWRIVGFVTLENSQSLETLVRNNPVVDAVVVALSVGCDDPEIARIRAGVALSMVLGWIILEPFVFRAAHLEGIDPDKVLGEMGRAVERAVDWSVESQGDRLMGSGRSNLQ